MTSARPEYSDLAAALAKAGLGFRPRSRSPRKLIIISLPLKNDSRGVYTQRDPTANVLYRLVYHLRNELEWRWDEQFQHQYGCLRKIVLKALDAYLNCGILLHGCARAECDKCGHGELIAMSCKRRCLCPSCDAKRALLFGEHLHNNVLLPYPYVHAVFTVPKRIRPFFKFDRKLLKHIYHGAWRAWQDMVEDALPEMKTGAVMALHTAGDLLNFHPHDHALCLYGALDNQGVFHQLDSIDLAYLTRCFRDYVLEALLKEELLDQETVTNMQSWEHSALLETENGHMVRITSTAKGAPRSRIIDPLEFLAELQQHIPDSWEQTVRYMGINSSRTRGAKRLALDTPGPLPDIEPAARPSPQWARCIKQVYLVDPLTCPKCGSTMRIRAFIHDQHEITRISKHLGRIPGPAPPAITVHSLRHAA